MHSLIICFGRFNDFLDGGRLRKGITHAQSSSYKSCQKDSFHYVYVLKLSLMAAKIYVYFMNPIFLLGKNATICFCVMSSQIS